MVRNDIKLKDPSTVRNDVKLMNQPTNKRPQRRSSTASEPRLQQRKSQQRGLRPTQAPYNVPIRNGTAKQDRGIRLHPASSAMALTEARNA
ncbi:hypothetical protein niasHT_004173 [Heterodera trifolii]|uniref:Uncharacterized protein n=1 Tax=Heterodera trifolii TaxID=157864 RepID=A0ABD2LQ61_9BILA